MDMAKALATIIPPKDLNGRYCVVKIPAGYAYPATSQLAATTKKLIIVPIVFV